MEKENIDILCFSTDVRGTHISEMANYAISNFGANYFEVGQISGRAYGIPTVTNSGSPLPFPVLRSNIVLLCLTAAENPDHTFHLPSLMFGDESYLDDDMLSTWIKESGFGEIPNLIFERHNHYCKSPIIGRWYYCLGKIFAGSMVTESPNIDKKSRNAAMTLKEFREEWEKLIKTPILKGDDDTELISLRTPKLHSHGIMENVLREQGKITAEEVIVDVLWRDLFVDYKYVPGDANHIVVTKEEFIEFTQK